MGGFKKYLNIANFISYLNRSVCARALDAVGKGMEITGKVSKGDLDRSFFETDYTDYHEIQFHSAKLDEALGVPVKEMEKSLRDKARRLQPEGTVESWSKSLHNGACTWVGLNPAQLQTPYAELLEILDELELAPGRR